MAGRLDGPCIRILSLSSGARVGRRDFARPRVRWPDRADLRGRETLDAGNLQRAATRSMAELQDFRYYGRPKDLPLPVWTAIFDGLNCNPAWCATRPIGRGRRELQTTVRAELKQVVLWQNEIQQGLRLWNTSLFTDRIQFVEQAGQIVAHSALPEVTLSQTDVAPALRKTKEFLEKLSRFNTPGKLRNLTMSEIGGRGISRLPAERLAPQDVLECVGRLQAGTSYLAQAQALLDPADEWPQRAEGRTHTLLWRMRQMAAGGEEVDLRGWERRLDELTAILRHSLRGTASGSRADRGWR